jgi:HEAT repeat protein
MPLASAALAGMRRALYHGVQVGSVKDIRRRTPSTAMADVKRSRQLSDRLNSLVSAFRDEDDNAIEAHRHFFQFLGDDRDIVLSHIADMLDQFLDRAAQDAASWALRAIGQEATMPVVVALRKSDPGRSRSLALRMLEELGPAAKDAIPALADMIENDSAHRERAGEVLAAIGADAVPCLIEAVRSAEDFAVLSVAIETLKAIGKTATDAVPVLIERLRDEDSIVRMIAAEALGAVGAKEAAPALIEGLRDEDCDVRALAAEALGAIGPASRAAVPMLVDMFRHENNCTMNGQFYHDTVSVALRSIGPAAVPGLRRISDLLDSALLRGSDDPDTVVRQHVKRLLAECQMKSRFDMQSPLNAELYHICDRLWILVDQNDSKTKERLRTLRSFVEHGSFRKVAAAESKRSGYETDHSSPASRLRSLGESLGVPITRICEGQGVKRSELTEEGRALAEWLDLNSWVID